MENLTPVLRWIDAARTTNDPAGDLIADMRRERETLPPLFRNRRHMRQFLINRKACPQALDAIPAVYRRYERFLARCPI